MTTIIGKVLDGETPLENTFIEFTTSNPEATEPYGFTTDGRGEFAWELDEFNHEYQGDKVIIITEVTTD